MPSKANLMNPRMEELLVRVDSKFTLVTLSAMRAREINDYYNQLGEGLGKIVPPQVTSVSRKPPSIAVEEIEVGKAEWQASAPGQASAGCAGASGSRSPPKRSSPRSPRPRRPPQKLRQPSSRATPTQGRNP